MLKVAAVLLALTSAAQAKECLFVTEDGWSAVPSPRSLTIQSPDGSEIICDIGSGGTGIMIMGLTCPDADRTSLFFAPSKMGGEDDLMITRNAVWYLDHCAEKI